MSEDRELDALERQLDSAFGTLRPRRGFEDELWSRIEARQGFWLRLRGRLRRVQLAPVLGGLAALAVVVLAGGLLLHAPHAGGASTTSAGVPLTHPGAGGAAANADNAPPQFGTLPRPAPPVAAPTEAATPKGVRAASYAGPVTVTAVTASVPLPAIAQVTRYPEWTRAQADAFAAAVGAQPAGPAPAGALGRYEAADFTVTVYPTDAAQGSEPRVVIAPKSAQPPGAPPADDTQLEKAAQDYLAAHQLAPDASAKGPTVDRAAQLVVQWRRYLGVGFTAFEVGATGIEEGWEVTWNGDLTILQAAGPVALVTEAADYSLATGQQLVELAKSAAGGTGPQVVLDTAQAVYVVATDGTYGYFEPAVMYTGRFTQGGVQYEKRIIVPAVAPRYMR